MDSLVECRGGEGGVSFTCGMDTCVLQLGVIIAVMLLVLAAIGVIVYMALRKLDHGKGIVSGGRSSNITTL